jgi:hypothetical protein
VRGGREWWLKSSFVNFMDFQQFVEFIMHLTLLSSQARTRLSSGKATPSNRPMSKDGSVNNEARGLWLQSCRVTQEDVWAFPKSALIWGKMAKKKNEKSTNSRSRKS